jgi:two-component system, OmpR family, sensor histidine kinase BaeS
MPNISVFHSMSLKSKLVLSFLVTILGTVLVLAFVVSLVVQNYLYSVQMQRLQYLSMNEAQNLERQYMIHGNSWDGLAGSQGPEDYMIVIVDTSDTMQLCSPPPSFSLDNCSSSTVQNALKQSLQAQNSLGSLQLSTSSGTSSAIYVSTPLVGGDNQVIGAMVIAQLNQSNGPGPGPRQGRGPADEQQNLLQNLNASIIIAAIAVAIVAALFGLWFARRFTRPLEALTSAAEHMKRGNYGRRAPAVNTQDELGTLSQTFNEMADKIESDMNELRRQDQVRRELIANIAHDLATPLTAIQGFSEALADDVIIDPDARQETAQRIGREVQRLRRMVADIRQMTMMESGQIKLDLAPLNLQSLVDETLVVVEPECEQMHISVQNQISAQIPLVLADSDRVTQVLLNLLDNARHHTPSGGMIRVEQGMVIVTVSDTGVGIDPADLPHIFERFYRADRSRASHNGGSGLGLSIVKAIVNAHGGRVWAESNPGHGTRISFTLPLAQVEQSPSLPSRPTTSSLAK